jgi:hypothetical protein
MSATAPVSPTSGLVWYDTSTGATYIYYNSTWVELGGGTMSPLPATSTTHPAAPWTGQTVYDTDTNRLLVWNGSAWVIPNSPAQNPTGLELITTCTVSSSGGTGATASNGVVTIGTGNTSVTISNAFSSTYDNYKIVISGGGGSVSSISVRLKLGSSATGYYGVMAYSLYSSGSALFAVDNNSTQFSFVANSGTNQFASSFDLLNPFLAKWTTIQNAGWVANNASGTYNGIHQVATSYSSFDILPESGTITGGTIRVYGYRNN